MNDVVALLSEAASHFPKAMKRILPFLCACGLMTASSQAAVWAINGTLDALQAGTNGGFGSFDGGITGAGDGTGTITGTYDDVTNLLSYTLSYENLTAAPTVIHFHVGAPGASGGVDLGIPVGGSPIVVSNAAVSASAETNLLAGDWYVNIHTSNFGGGEIRGQVSAVPEAGASVLALGAAGLLLLRRRRS